MSTDLKENLSLLLSEKNYAEMKVRLLDNPKKAKKIRKAKKRKVALILSITITCVVILALLVAAIVLMALKEEYSVVGAGKSVCGTGYCYIIDGEIFDINNGNYTTLGNSARDLTKARVTAVIVPLIGFDMFSISSNYSNYADAVSALKEHGIKTFANIGDIGSVSSDVRNRIQINNSFYSVPYNGRYIINYENPAIVNTLLRRLFGIGRMGVGGIFVTGIPQIPGADGKLNSNRAALNLLRNGYSSELLKELHFITSSDVTIYPDPENFTISLSGTLNIRGYDIVKTMKRIKVGQKIPLEVPKAIKNIENIYSTSNSGFQDTIAQRNNEFKLVTSLFTLLNGNVFLYPGDEFQTIIKRKNKYPLVVNSLSSQNNESLEWIGKLIELRNEYVSLFANKTVYGTRLDKNLLLFEVGDVQSKYVGELAIVWNSSSKARSFKFKQILKNDFVKYKLLYNGMRFGNENYKENDNIMLNSYGVAIISLTGTLSRIPYPLMF